MPPHERIGRNDRVEFKQGFASHRLGLARQKSTLGVGEADAPSSEPVLGQSVLSLKEFDNDQLMAMNPASGDHQQKRQQRWYRADAIILPAALRS